MLVLNIQTWDTEAKRTTERQIAIRKIRTDQRGFGEYRAVLLEPGVTVPTQGPNKAKIPVNRASHTFSIVGHRVTDGNLELTFRALRELRQEVPELFETPAEIMEANGNANRRLGLSKLSSVGQ